MRPARKVDAGVTLIEVLVSLAIFAVIALAGLSVLEMVARTGERTDGRLDRLAEIDRAFLVIGRDLAQMAGLDTQLNEDGLTFQRLKVDGSLSVSYGLEDAVFKRRIIGVGPTPTDQRLLPGVGSAQWRLLDTSRRWTTLWPPEGISTPRRPLAAELTFEVARDGVGSLQTVTRVFALPAGQGQ